MSAILNSFMPYLVLISQFSDIASVVYSIEVVHF